jgi:hypothetical protein
MLWIPFHRHLSTNPCLEPFEVDLVCFNPKLVASFKDALVLCDSIISHLPEEVKHHNTPWCNFLGKCPRVRTASYDELLRHVTRHLDVANEF